MLYKLEHGGIINTDYIGAITEITVKLLSESDECRKHFELYRCNSLCKTDEEWKKWFTVKRMEDVGFSLNNENHIVCNNNGFPIRRNNDSDNEIMLYLVHMAFPAPAGLSSGHMKLYMSCNDLNKIMRLK